jgi:hypothetical protein
LKEAGIGPLLTKKAGYSLRSPIYNVPKFKELFYPPPSSKTIERCYSTLVPVISIALGRSYPSTLTLIRRVIKSASFEVKDTLTLLISSGSIVNEVGSIIRP